MVFSMDPVDIIIYKNVTYEYFKNMIEINLSFYDSARKIIQAAKRDYKSVYGKSVMYNRIYVDAKPVILLIDEYDVPVAKANNNGYYNEMLDVMKGLMQALKDNQALQFAVVTGCLKIAKESIFTGTNNFVSDTITNSRLNEYFGFVQSEVDLLLKDADLTTQAENIKKWYDG